MTEANTPLLSLCAITRISSRRISSTGPLPPKEPWCPESNAITSESIPRARLIVRMRTPNCGTLTLANQPPGARYEFPAKEIVDAGFLELVRYGIRSANDPVIKDSLRIVDAVLKVETSHGPAWRRYNHDGYGQRDA